MKRILSFAAVCGLSIGAFAQTIVSTTPSNRSVLLEDLTGIFCGYCPDGALRADQLKAAYPGRVVIIGNHAGSYANANNPAAFQFDFRTTEGTLVDNFSDPSGYPAGNINRKLTPVSMKPGKTAMGRGNWTTEGTKILNEPSPANLAVSAYYNVGSEDIEINVEGYYTSNGNASDYLTVAILQDNIDSYQSGASGYPARIQPGSNLYRQMDVLRAYVTTPYMGEEISVTTASTFFEREYTYTAVKVGPHIDPVKDNMKVAVWLSQDATFSEVITAVETHVSARPVGISEAASLKGLNIYPNPFVDQATVEFELEDAQMMEFKLFDVTGKLVQNVPSSYYGTGNHKINVSGNGLENGLYYVNIIAEDGIVTRRIVLNR